MGVSRTRLARTSENKLKMMKPTFNRSMDEELLCLFTSSLIDSIEKIINK